MNAPASTTEIQRAAFLQDVLGGLSTLPRTIPSRWLYDERGSQLFEEITGLKEYYPTRTERAILGDNAFELAEFLGPNATLIEYGSGASLKTQILLDAADDVIEYVPIDISEDFMRDAVGAIHLRFPSLKVTPLVGDFTAPITLPRHLLDRDGICCFFPGSTIGNLSEEEASLLLRQMRRHAGDKGRAIIGFDLIKDLKTLIEAYDDPWSVTADFNKNLIRRINRELNANIPTHAFLHEARWNQLEQAVEMHLVAAQAVTFNVGGLQFDMAKGETIHTESSRKYTLEKIEALAESSGWRVERTWRDVGRRFAVIGLIADHVSTDLVATQKRPGAFG